ncbi:MAG: hypothetical protein ABW250_06990 [Pyrinomonadaceae bacterium]
MRFTPLAEHLEIYGLAPVSGRLNSQRRLRLRGEDALPRRAGIGISEMQLTRLD